MNCPKCGGESNGWDDGYIEIGEWNGNRFDEEFSVDGYQCVDCGTRFWVEE